MATKKYPMHFLNLNYPHECRDYKKLASINEDDDSARAMAIICLNKNCQFFVGNAETDTAEDPLYRVRWRQVSEQSNNMKPELVYTVLKIPAMIETYYSASCAIYRHNNQRQYDIGIDL